MLSKGHDYANITLSVIMGLDYILGLSDYRARERAISLLFQIAGRSGRSKHSDVIIQTANMEFFANYLQDYEEFIKDELIVLELAEYPPFVSLARVLISDKKEQKCIDILNFCVDRLKEIRDINIVGYGKAPVEKIANKFRYTVLLKSKDRIGLLKALHTINSKDIEIDFDPIEFS
jgi:primosomal protein N' (replication factor Y)